MHTQLTAVLSTFRNVMNIMRVINFVKRWGE